MFYVVVNFLSPVIFIFLLFSTSLAYITIPKNKRKTKINSDKKLPVQHMSYRGHYFTVYCLCFSGYLNMFCKLLKENLDKMPGDLRTQIGFITFNSTVHFYSLKVGDFHITGLC